MSEHARGGESGLRRLRRCVREAVHDALIVPAAHTRVLDSELQSELYEVFHTGPVARWGHAICTPITNTALLALAGELTIELATGSGHATVPGGVAAAIVALAFYLAVHGAWALAMAPLLGIALLAAGGLRALAGDDVVVVACAIAAVSTVVQTLSHALEPVPPPWAPGRAFAPPAVVLPRIPWWRALGLVAAAVLVYPVLELWAAPRVWPLQVAHALGRLGVLRARAARMRARVEAIHRDASAGWELPG